MAKNKKDLKTDQYWENRILCSDESCIGVIGPDGCCKECGKNSAGDFSKTQVPDKEVALPDDTEPDESEIKEAIEASITSAAVQPVDSPAESGWESRTLCSDESCIGIIGPDGRCKECGQSFQS